MVPTVTLSARPPVRAAAAPDPPEVTGAVVGFVTRVVLGVRETFVAVDPEVVDVPGAAGVSVWASMFREPPTPPIELMRPPG